MINEWRWPSRRDMEGSKMESVPKERGNSAAGTGEGLPVGEGRCKSRIELLGVDALGVVFRVEIL
jgi:hypothetical protein